MGGLSRVYAEFMVVLIYVFLAEKGRFAMRNDWKERSCIIVVEVDRCRE